METEQPDHENPRDRDLVALEGLEAEFTELEAELSRTEASRENGPGEHGA